MRADSARRRPRLWAWLLIGGLELILLALAGVGAVSVFRRVSRELAPEAPPTYLMQVPPGFGVGVYAEIKQANFPTVIAFGPDGNLYVLMLDGQLFVAEDRDQDIRAETVRRIFSNDQHTLSHAVGLAFHDGVLYVSDSGRISTLADSDGDGVLDTLTPIVEGLISLRYPDHSNNGIAFGPDGKLYVGVGSTTDHGPLTTAGEAAILRLNPDGSGLEVFATGFRNPYDLTFSPDGDLFTADNNPSEFDRTLRSLEPEELDHARAGRDYGFPRVYGNPPPGDASEPPVTEFYASVGSAGLTYYAADQFPEAYRHGVFVAQ